MNVHELRERYAELEARRLALLADAKALGLSEPNLAKPLDPDNLLAARRQEIRRLGFGTLVRLFPGGPTGRHLGFFGGHHWAMWVSAMSNDLMVARIGLDPTDPPNSKLPMPSDEALLGAHAVMCSRAERWPVDKVSLDVALVALEQLRDQEHPLVDRAKTEHAIDVIRQVTDGG